MDEVRESIPVLSAAPAPLPVPSVREPEGLFVDRRLVERKRSYLAAKAHDVPSFLALLRRHGNEKTVVYAAPERLVAVMDDDALRGTVELGFLWSPAFLEWGTLARGATVRDLQAHVLRRGAECRTPEFLTAVARVRFNVSISVVEEVTDARNLNVAFSQKEGKGSVNIPREVTVRAPVYHRSAHEHDLLFDVDYRIPTEPGKATVLSLTLRDKAAALDAALEAEVADIQDALPGDMLLVRGTPTPM